MKTAVGSVEKGLGILVSSSTITITDLTVGTTFIFNFYINRSSGSHLSVNAYTGFTSTDVLGTNVSTEGVSSSTFIGMVTDTTVTFTFSATIPDNYLFTAYQVQ